MKREEEVTMSGRVIIVLTPENEEDERELERMAREGKLDARDGFSSDPDVWLKPGYGQPSKPPADNLT